MARLSTSTIILQYVSIIILCWDENVACVYTEPTQKPLCSFPPGSIACKIWNNTNMDCSWRALVCIPPLKYKASLELLDLSNNKLTVLPKDAFFGLDKLQSLDVSSNSISTLHGGAFNGLHNLLKLDLSYNNISLVDEATFAELSNLKHLDLTNLERFHKTIFISSPFQNLASLMTLDMSVENAVISSATFTGLNSLQHLSIGIAETFPHNPLSQLPSLLYLDLDLNTCNLPERLFDGLNKLQYLLINLDKECTHNVTNVDLCPLVSLRTLSSSSFWNITNNCLKTIPLKSLSLNTLYISSEYTVSFEMLNHLSSLSWTTKVDGHTSMQTLSSLDSPLQNLTFHQVGYLTLNSTTFESCHKWSKFLQILDISTDTGILIDGSPFKWFPKLLILRLSGQYYYHSIIKALSNITFSGLSSLKELRLTFLHIEYLAPGTLDIFGLYNSLKILDLSHNDIYDDDKLTQICNIKSLQESNLSYNKFQVYFDHPCILPNLKVLNIGNQKQKTGLYIDILFRDFPNLNIFRNKHGAWSLRFDVLCPNLATMHSSFSNIYLSNGFILAPQLENLYLSGITLKYNQAITSISILNIFKAPQLRMIDLSSNQISVVDKRDVMLLNNITYLDLRYNQLVSLINLQQLSNIKVLLLGGNKINIVPISLLSNKPLLNALDMHDNPYTCDCNIEDFQRWLLTNTEVALWNNFSDSNHYMCAAPDSQKRMSITEIHLDCSTNILMYTLVGTASFVFLIITTILAVKYHWHIRYRFFLLFNRRRNHQNYLVNDDEAPEDYENEGGLPRYDAYVTYHNEDEDWVDGELLPNIEEGDEPFRLCLKTRDIRGGRLKLNELSLRIQRSRKILVILSPQFVEDNWCYFELNMAHQKALEESYKVLIFIIKENIPNDRLTLVLRQLLCRVQCFKWPDDEYGQRLFWRRLREELKRPVPVDRRFNL